MTRVPRSVFWTVVAAAVLVGACTSAAGTPSPAASTPAGVATSVEVALQEWAVLPARASAPAGAVSFRVTNNGPDDEHELVVIKTELDAGALPTDANGAVDEAGGGMEVIGEIEDIAVGQTEELITQLVPGKYVLICNIYDESEKEAHYRLGMRVAFTVGG